MHLQLDGQLFRLSHPISKAEGFCSGWVMRLEGGLKVPPLVSDLDSPFSPRLHP